MQETAAIDQGQWLVLGELEWLEMALRAVLAGRVGVLEGTEWRLKSTRKMCDPARVMTWSAACPRMATARQR